MRSAQLSVVIAVLGVLLVACFARSQPVIRSGTMGTNEQVGPISLRNVYVVAPEGDLYRIGESTVAPFELYNSSDQLDALLGVYSPAAAQVRLRWDRECDGDDEIVSRLPILPEGTVPQPAGARPGGMPYYLEIVALTDEVRPGTTFPLTFVFERAGTADVDALVQVSGDTYVPPPPTC